MRGSNDPLERKLFNSQNINQMFQLVFNLIINGSSAEMLQTSVELLSDLLKRCDRACGAWLRAELCDDVRACLAAGAA